MRQYRGFDTDNSRWDGFEFRDGDIVISSPMKAGTTWMQMICALLIFKTADLPALLTELSPWLDHQTQPLDEVLAVLDGQAHRRFIKTHTPVDGLPIDPRVTYIGVGRHPLDLAVSAAHHSSNIDFGVVFARVAATVGERGAIDRLSGRPIPATDPRERLAFFIHDDAAPDEALTLVSVMEHYSTFFETPGTLRFHYFDLQTQLGEEMHRLADALGIEVPDATWNALVAAARFESMKSRASVLAPDVDTGIFKDPEGFFRSAGRGEWRSILDDDDIDAFEKKIDEVALRPEIAVWARHGMYS